MNLLCLTHFVFPFILCSRWNLAWARIDSQAPKSSTENSTGDQEQRSLSLSNLTDLPESFKLEIDIDTDTISNDRYQYEFDVKGITHRYLALGDYKFKAVKKGSLTLWTSPKKLLAYVVTIEIGDDGLYHTKAYTDHQTYSYSIVNSEDQYKVDYKFDSAKVELHTLDDGNYKKLGKEDYEVNTEYDGTLKFTIKNGIQCYLIAYNNSTIWTHRNDRHGEKFPRVLYFFNDGKLKFAINTLFYEVDVKNLLARGSKRAIPFKAFKFWNADLVIKFNMEQNQLARAAMPLKFQL